MNSIFDAERPLTSYVKRAWIAAIILALLQTAIIGYTIESHASILQSGTEVVLKTAPIDPRDLLRGDYVILNYEISSVPASTIVGGLPKEAGEQVLSVRLHKEPDGFWRIAELSFGSLRRNRIRSSEEPAVPILCWRQRADVPGGVRHRALLRAGRRWHQA